MLPLGQCPTVHSTLIPHPHFPNTGTGPGAGAPIPFLALLSVPLAQELLRLAEEACSLQAPASLQDACELGVGLQLVLDVLQECLAHKSLGHRIPRMLDGDALHCWDSFERQVTAGCGTRPGRLLMISHLVQPKKHL